MSLVASRARRPLCTARALPGPEIDAQVEVSSLKVTIHFSALTLMSAATYVKSDAASPAASAHVLLMTGSEQNASLPPPLEDEITSEELQTRRRKLTSK